jgi:hypothetical protein
MALDREAQEELNRRSDRLSSLLMTVGWGEMEAEVERKCERLRKTAASIALHPDGADQRKIDTIRGTIAALQWFVGVPRHASATLERFLREQGIEVEEEELEQQRV